MAKVYLICGKICSGKTYYARTLARQHNGVILSTDEVTSDLIHNEQGEFYNVFAARVNGYLRKKAVQIAAAGANVILDWGFWTEQDRQDISAYLRDNQTEFEWHYVDTPEQLWLQNIRERNERIASGNPGNDFYVDDGLLRKLNSLFQAPDRAQMDVWYRPERM